VDVQTQNKLADDRARSFDTVFAAEKMKIIRTPYRVSQANAVAEHWIHSACQECLDRILILNEQHLFKVLTEYVAIYNGVRPRQGLEQRHRSVLEKPSGRGIYIVEKCWVASSPTIIERPLEAVFPA
jgi:hypothetical protein